MVEQELRQGFVKGLCRGLCGTPRTRQGDVDREEAVGREVLYGVRDALLAQHARHVPVQRAHAHLHPTGAKSRLKLRASNPAGCTPCRLNTRHSSMN